MQCESGNLCLRQFSRKTNGNGRALARNRIDADLSVMQKHRMLDDGKAKTRSLDFFRTAFIRPVEAFKDPFLFRRLDPDSGG